ncbi:protein refolding chaperone Spy/CpxP family [Granulicella rosea]|uniref:Protein refolding chaperone Spy/CpxP family n=1 Tax=Granulicella rosea TaxID=474952 RepID=A0A239M8P0_9BACT|nr:Spy/CpxP family protein refolding chaperone [Granulicella rosea]SNT39307.1 protein refolding chaperone Spy/CpxP family [Granulicella rosea]
MKIEVKLRLRAAMLAMCMLSVCGLPALAQDSGAPPAPPSGQDGPPQGGRGDREAAMLARLTRDLSLTDDQVKQVTVIEDDARQKMMALRNDTSTAQADKRTKMMAIREESQAKIRAILTDEQKTKFDEMEAKMKARGAGGPGGGDPPQPPPQA